MTDIIIYNNELLIGISLMDLLELYYAIRWHVEETQEHLQNKKYKDYLKRITDEFKRREILLGINK
jgi:hypothetical protein